MKIKQTSPNFHFLYMGSILWLYLEKNDAHYPIAKQVWNVLFYISEAKKICITKTRPCNIQGLFKTVKMTIFSFVFFIIFIFLLKPYIVGTR